MPTGYTGKIYEGKTEVSGKDFIKSCARAFGGLMHMRDEDSDAPWTLVDVDSQIKYSQDSLARSIDRLNKLDAMTDEEIAETIEASYQNQIKENAEAVIKQKDLKARYEKVLKEVEDWQPPTDEHISVKEFAIDQLKKSIDYDCDYSYYEKPVTKQTVEEYKTMMSKILNEGIDRDKKSIKEAVKRVEEKNQWILKLQKSLK